MSRPVKRSFTIKGHRTSATLEAPFWEALEEAASSRGVTVAALAGEIDSRRGGAGLSSAMRVWLLAYAREGGPVSP